MRDPTCVFCAILSGDASTSFVLRRDRVAAFMAVPQAGLGHVLVVPTDHHATAMELPDGLGGELFETTVGIARAVDRLYHPNGISLVQNNRPAAGQSVFHVHLHVLPRTEGKRVRFDDPEGVRDRATLDRLAADIAAEVAKPGG